MSRGSSSFRLSLATSGILSGLLALDSPAVENHSLLILTSSAKEVPTQPSKDSTNKKEDNVLSFEQAESTSPSMTNVTDSEVETIRERYPNGSKRIEKQVALDANGDFKNHGLYEEWSLNGELVSTGRFEMGLRQGPWTKMCRTQDAKLFDSYPYSNFKSPFQSTVEFASDEMNGVWMITDANQRIVSQILLKDGVRDGVSTWFHPNGKVLYQAEYTNGVLDGAFVEKDQNEKVIRNEQYAQGKRIEVEREFYPSKTLKSEISFLTASPSSVSKDNWESSTLAVFDKATDKVKHGNFQSFFENAQVKSKGTYEHGLLTGEFESYFSNGQKESAGSYEKGKQNGKWTWWHANGMPATSATYSDGVISGEVLAWNELGKRITDTKSFEYQVTVNRETAAPQQATRATANR